MEEKYPLIIVFYLDVEMMKIKQIIEPFVESVNLMISQKGANVLAFFIPTSGEERIECINPLVVPQVEMEKINKIIEDIKKNFSVGDDGLLSGDTATIETKQCVCGKNPDGECQCNETQE